MNRMYVSVCNESGAVERRVRGGRQAVSKLSRTLPVKGKTKEQHCRRSGGSGVGREVVML